MCSFVFCRNLLMVVHFTDISYANNTFSLCQLSSPNILSSVLLENEGIPVVKFIVHPNIYSSYSSESNRDTVA